MAKEKWTKYPAHPSNVQECPDGVKPQRSNDPPYPGTRHLDGWAIENDAVDEGKKDEELEYGEPSHTDRLGGGEARGKGGDGADDRHYGNAGPVSGADGTAAWEGVVDDGYVGTPHQRDDALQVKLEADGSSTLGPVEKNVIAVESVVY